MRRASAVLARARLLFARRAAESHTTDEFAFHLAMESERLVREHGLEPNEARRRALAAFGGVENHKEALRSFLVFMEHPVAHYLLHTVLLAFAGLDRHV